MYAKNAQPSVVVDCVRVIGPAACTAMLGTAWPAASSTLTPIEPVAAE